MRVANLSSSNGLSAPSICASDARWAAEALASLVRQLDSDSVIGVVLRRTQRELQSLAGNTPNYRTDGGSEVVGPIRVRMAA